MNEQHYQILITGATGYIGGTVLHQLVNSTLQSLKAVTLTCLLRGEERSTRLQELYGDRVRPLLYKDLDDIERIIDIASQHDIVINMTHGFHTRSAVAFVDGLAKRKEYSGRDTFMIQTSGTANLADQPLTGRREDHVFDNSKDDVYSYEKQRQAEEPFLARTTELAVIDRSLEKGVQSLVIMSPAIYGVGTGVFNKRSIQIPAYIRETLKQGQTVLIGEGDGVWGNVHVEDLAQLYELALVDILSTHGTRLPFGKKGIIFSSTSSHTGRDIAEGVAKVAYDAGEISTAELKKVGLQEGADLLCWGNAQLAELIWVGTSRTSSVVGRQLGWEPSRGLEAWEKGFKEELDAFLQQGSR